MNSLETNKISLEERIVNESATGYEKAELNLLREALNRSYTERFLMATRLYKIQLTLSRAKITHKPYNLNK